MFHINFAPSSIQFNSLFKTKESLSRWVDVDAIGGLKERTALIEFRFPILKRALHRLLARARMATWNKEEFLSLSFSLSLYLASSVTLSPSFSSLPSAEALTMQPQ